jgi:hypothetical protein
MVSLIVTLIVVGLLLWAVNAVIPMDPWVKKIVNVLVVVCLCLWLLSGFGLLGGVAFPRWRG